MIPDQRESTKKLPHQASVIHVSTFNEVDIPAPVVPLPGLHAIEREGRRVVQIQLPQVSLDMQHPM